MSDWLQRNQWVYVALFAIAVVMLWRATSGGGDGAQSNSDNVSDETWFYDLATGETFRAKRDLVPPIKSPAGNDAAWATMYGCGGCAPGQRFVGYLTRHTDELKARADADPGVRAGLYGQSVAGRLYSTDGKAWIAADNPEKAGIDFKFAKQCPSGDIRRCP